MSSATAVTHRIVGEWVVAIIRMTQSTDDVSNTIKTLARDLALYSDKIPPDIKQNIEVFLGVTKLSKEAQVEVAEQLKQSQNGCQQLLDKYQEWSQQNDGLENDILKLTQKIENIEENQVTLRNKIKKLAMQKFDLSEKCRKATEKKESREIEDPDKLEKELGKSLIKKMSESIQNMEKNWHRNREILPYLRMHKEQLIVDKAILKQNYTTRLIPPSMIFIEHLADIIRDAQIPVEQRKKTE